jgi:hypothetical protein
MAVIPDPDRRNPRPARGRHAGSGVLTEAERICGSSAIACTSRGEARLAKVFLKQGSFGWPRERQGGDGNLRQPAEQGESRGGAPHLRGNHRGGRLGERAPRQGRRLLHEVDPLCKEVGNELEVAKSYRAFAHYVQNSETGGTTRRSRPKHPPRRHGRGDLHPPSERPQCPVGRARGNLEPRPRPRGRRSKSSFRCGAWRGEGADPTVRVPGRGRRRSSRGTGGAPDLARGRAPLHPHRARLRHPARLRGSGPPSLRPRVAPRNLHRQQPGDDRRRLPRGGRDRAHQPRRRALRRRAPRADRPVGLRARRGRRAAAGGRLEPTARGAGGYGSTGD